MNQSSGSNGTNGAAAVGGDFSPEQKRYLEGFAAGVDLLRSRRGLTPLVGLLASQGAPAPARGAPEAVEAEDRGPGAVHRRAQDRFLAAGKKLSPEEEAKRAKDPLEMWDEVAAHARDGRFPKGPDVFRFKFHGLFYVAPAQDAYMCRLRLPGGLLSSWQMRGVADIAERFAGGYADVTTRANLQLREIPAARATDVLLALQDLGVVNRGAGADNVRNVTGSPTAGIDPQEIADTRPLSRAMHYHILYHRELYGLPRKFNIAFDGGGQVGVLEDTNDLGFSAVRVPDGQCVPAGVWFRMALGGITGHGEFARDAGVVLRAEDCVPVADAVLRVFIEHGDRSDRRRARLKYLVESWGLERFVDETEKRLGRRLPRLGIERCEPRGPVLRQGHVGFHAQRQEGLFWCGVVLPAGRLSAGQMRGLADLAERHGSGSIRLTVWQNLIVADIPQASIPEFTKELAALGLSASASGVRAGLVACTGNGGCRYAASDTKGHALALAEHLESRLELDGPINIHLTGCPHSCAQHYAGDIGLLGTKVERGGEAVEGYHVLVGGGAGADRGLGREICRGVPFDEVKGLLERMLRVYLERRSGAGETFVMFTRRHSVEELKRWFAIEDATMEN